MCTVLFPFYISILLLSSVTYFTSETPEGDTGLDTSCNSIFTFSSQSVTINNPFGPCVINCLLEEPICYSLIVAVKKTELSIIRQH